MIIEIHMIQNYAPSNLNRDDTGSPKSCLFGGVRRSRISSQCIKRSIRRSPVFKEEIEKIGIGYRTRLLPELIKKRLIELGISETHAQIVAIYLKSLGTSAKKSEAKSKAKKKEPKEEEQEEEKIKEEKPKASAKKKEGVEKLITKQIMFFSSAELDNLANILKEQIKSAKSPEDVNKALEKFDLENEIEKNGQQPISPDMALFGRMVTSTVFPNVEASMQVAHALSTHKIEQEFDYYTAVDDLIRTSETTEAQGAGMIGDVEFNSACYYKYFSLDFENFLENMVLNGSEIDNALKAQLIDVLLAFLKAATFTTPSGKQNTFAAHQLPDCILIELREQKIPVSYANAFINPCQPKVGKDLVDVSIECFSSYVKNINEKYGLKCKERLWFNTRNAELPNTKSCNTFEALLSTFRTSLK